MMGRSMPRSFCKVIAGPAECVIAGASHRGDESRLTATDRSDGRGGEKSSVGLHRLGRALLAPFNNLSKFLNGIRGNS